MKKAILDNKTVIVVAGGTREYIDDVRVLTNISSGKLGAEIADALYYEGANVIYIYAKGSVLPNGLDIKHIEISTVADLVSTLENLTDITPDGVIMAVAASDFTFKRDVPIKLKSNDPEAFIEYMRQTITTNPKVISKIKEWFPETYLVGFKFEVGLEHEQLIEIARESMRKNKADIVIANDKAEMEKSKQHIGYLVTEDNEIRCENKDDIGHRLVEHLTNVL